MSHPLVIRSRYPGLSFRLNRRVPPTVLALTLLTLAAMVVNIGLGEYPIAPLDVAQTLLGAGNPEHHFIVNTLRLPRTLVAFFVGVGLALSGAILQGLTRNALASPQVVGVSGGASLAATTMIVLVPSAPVFFLPFVAFGGALAAAFLAYLLAWQQGSSPIRLILVGIGIAAIAHALITLVITYGQIYRVHQATIWMTGSVYGRSWEHLWPMLPWFAVFLPLSLLMSRHLNALQFGDDVARGLGGRIETHRGVLLLTSVALAGTAVATAGPVGFVGLMAPHIARGLVGPMHGGLLPTAGVTGALLVVVADMLGRTLFAPFEIPCGVITAVIGAPYFIYLLYRNRNV